MFFCTLIIIFGCEGEFHILLASRFAAITIAEGNSLVLVDFQLEAALQAFQDGVVELGTHPLVGVNCLVIELAPDRVEVCKCPILNVIDSAVQSGAFVHELGAFLLRELLELPLEQLVLRLALASSQDQQNKAGNG